MKCSRKRCERLCSRPCVALVFTVLVLMCLVVAVALSWYFIWMEDVPLNQTCENGKESSHDATIGVGINDTFRLC